MESPESIGKRTFHYVVYYNEETQNWGVETYEASDGDIWDSELDEWRWADDDIVAGETDLDGSLYKELELAVDKLPKPKMTPAGQEPDLLYGNEEV